MQDQLRQDPGLSELGIRITTGYHTTALIYHLHSKSQMMMVRDHVDLLPSLIHGTRACLLQSHYTDQYPAMMKQTLYTGHHTTIQTCGDH